MKIRRIMHLLIGLCMVISACDPNKDEVQIALSIEGVEDGEKMSVSLGCTHAEQPDITTATIQNGKASFCFIGEGPRMYYMRVKGVNGLLKVMADKGDRVKVKATAEKNLNLDGTLYYVFNNVTVKGSQTHREYEERNLDQNRLNNIYPHYQDKYADVLDAMSKATSQAQRDSILATKRGKEMVEAETNFIQTVKKVYYDCFLDNRDSWWGPLLMLDNMNSLTQNERDVFEQFSDRAKQSFYGKIAHDLLYPEAEKE